MKLAIGIPASHGFPVEVRWVTSFVLMQQWLLTGVGNRKHPDAQIDAATVLWSHDFPTDFARNQIVRGFLDKTEHDYLLFLDADMTHPPDLAQLLYRHREDVVTARYVMRKPPFFTVAMRKIGPDATDYQAIEKLVPHDRVNGLIPIDAGGAGALLISRRTLVAIRDRIGDDWFRYQDGPDGKRSRSEDMWFYEQARACGIQPYLDADVRCGHRASFLVDDRFHEPYQEAYLRQQEALAV